MGNINVLGFDVANLIAAGEVVDRPASVLKELLENAIDAGATAVTAEIRRGGVAMLRVSDNGCGMTAEDLPIAIRRHATSKIRTAEDLDAIDTLGFRGEALAAIAAVSELRILSKPRDAASGTLLTAEGGRVTDISEVGCADGTTVVVENIFANVPARRKFLKKDATETMACAAVVEKIAMSRPDIAFTFVTDGSTRFSTAGDGDLKGTLYALLGRDFAHRLLAVKGEAHGLSVSGFIGTSDNVRNNRNHQNMFINGRYIKSKTMMAAVEKAYTSYIAPERFPVCALFLSVQPTAVDVNVHPAKLEVKFSDERAVFEVVYYAVRSALEAGGNRPELNLTRATRGRSNPLSAFVPLGEKTAGKQMAATLFDTPRATPAYTPAKTAAPTPAAETGVATDAAIPPAPAPATATAHAPTRSAAHPAPGATLSVRESLRLMRAAMDDGETGTQNSAASTTLAAPAKLAKNDEKTHESQPVCRENAGNPAKIPPVTPETAAARTQDEPVSGGAAAPAGDLPIVEDAPAWRIVGEAFRCYVFVEMGNELLLIDKHAAHERILFERLRREQQRDGRVASQPLLLPLTVHPTEDELAAAEEYRAELEAVGFAFAVSRDARRIEVNAIPDAIAAQEAEELFTRMTAELSEGAGNPAVTEAMRRERTLYQVACKAAIKGGRLYGDGQIAWLVGEVLSLPDLTVCPHGRPIAVRLTKNALDRQFDRIM